MPEKKRTNNGIASARFIDHLDRVIYKPFNSVDGYVIPRDKEDEFHIYSMRIVLVAFVTCVIAMLGLFNVFDVILIGVGLYIVVQLFFSWHLLSKCQVIKNVKVPLKEPYFVRLSKSQSVKTFMGMIAMALIFMVILIVYLATTELDAVSFGSTLIVTICVGIFVVFQSIALYIRMKDDKKQGDNNSNEKQSSTKKGKKAR